MRGPSIHVLPGGRGGEYGRSRCIREAQRDGDRAGAGLHTAGFRTRPRDVAVLRVRVQHPEHRGHLSVGVHHAPRIRPGRFRLGGDPHLRGLRVPLGRGLCGPGLRHAPYGRRLCVPKSDVAALVRIRHGRDDDHHVLPPVAGARRLARFRLGRLPAAHGPRRHDGKPHVGRLGRLVPGRLGPHDCHDGLVHDCRPCAHQESRVSAGSCSSSGSCGTASSSATSSWSSSS